MAPGLPHAGSSGLLRGHQVVHHPDGTHQVATGDGRDGRSHILDRREIPARGHHHEDVPLLFYRVGLRGVGGQEHQPEQVLVGLDKLGDGVRLVAGCTVQDQQDPGMDAQHSPQEPLERLGVAGIDGADVEAVEPQHAEYGHRLFGVAGLEDAVSVGRPPPVTGIGPEAGVYFVAGEHREPLAASAAT